MGDHRVVCLPEQFPANDVAEVLRGRVVFAGLPPVDLGTGEIDWLADPHRNRSWSMNLHALRWMGRLVVEYERTGGRAHLDRAAAVAADWVRANPRGGRGVSPWAWAEHPVALRAPALAALAAYLTDRWLAESLAEHGETLADPALYREGHNHGLDQDIGLLLVGHRLGHAAWTDLAVRRMAASAELAIDPQGVLHEQAPRYGLHVYRRLGVAIRLLERCGAPVPAVLVARRALLEGYVRHATQPDGRLVAIGDGPADLQGIAAGPGDEPRETTRVFDGGYVFGRTAWGDPRSAYYSIRFGPGRRLHGHEDHLGVTYQARGRDVLVEAGFHSYERTDYARWTATPEAHNVPIVPGAEFRPGTPTRLTRAVVGPDRQCFELADDAYGVRRTRAVLVHHGPDLLAVLDSAAPGSVLRSVWHFAPALDVEAERPDGLVLGGSGGPVAFVQLAVPGLEAAAGREVGTGTVATGYLRTAPVVTVTSPAAARLLTLIVPGCADPRVSRDGDGVVVRTAAGPVAFTLAELGYAPEAAVAPRAGRAEPASNAPAPGSRK